MGAIIAVLGLLALAGLMIVAISVVRGYVLTYLWLWFVVPFGLPPLSIPWAIGLAGIVGYLTISTAAKTKEQEWYVTLATALIHPFLVLGIGYVVHLFM